MRLRRILIYHSPGGLSASVSVAEFAQHRGLEIVVAKTTEEILEQVNQNFPLCIVCDGSGGSESIRLCTLLKRDPFLAIIPVVFILDEVCSVLVLNGFQAGADEVLTPVMGKKERITRLGVALDRADRDVSVHPTTRLPGTTQIKRDMADRVRRGETFAVCYADLDHFKEFNDRYGYNEGDNVILLVARILRDVVRGREPGGFVGHIGGDDFIFNIPVDLVHICCEEIIETFDELIPYQYSEGDRDAGYFLGKDRHGNLSRIPVMTLSIGVVTNQDRRFTHTARISELATDMKTYAKSIDGSVYVIDSRRETLDRVVTKPVVNATDDVIEE